MNLKTRKKILKKRNLYKKENHTGFIITGIVLSLSVISLSVFGITAHFDGKSQEMTKNISKSNSQIYTLDREIQNLKLQYANRTRKDFVMTKINNNEMGLKLAARKQVVMMPSTGVYENLLSDENIERVAYYKK